MKGAVYDFSGRRFLVIREKIFLGLSVPAIPKNKGGISGDLWPSNSAETPFQKNILGIFLATENVFWVLNFRYCNVEENIFSFLRVA